MFIVTEYAALRTKFDIESGPTDLEVFKLYRSLTTPFESMTISSIFGIVLLDIFGIIESVTFVNTDWNCSTRILALPLESDIRLRSFLSGDTPILSFFPTFHILPERFGVVVIKTLLNY